MKDKKRKITFILIIFILIIVNFGLNITKVFAAINQNYGETAAPVDLPGESADSGTLLGLLTLAIVSVGSLLEWLTSMVIGLLIGSAGFFPWADKIIFNTIPIIDVNFINPAAGSLFMGTDGVTFTTVGNVIRSIYFTGLSIGLGFLGIIVAVMAIKMAISTIASEKAKYKESIVTWLTAIVLLFGLHYALSFVFYLNEKMVEIASNIVVTQLANSDQTAIGGTSNDSVEKIVSNMGEYFKEEAIGDVDSGFLGTLLSADEAKPVPGILYTMLVFQSLMFLFAYLKRFFYVVILAVIGPFVVVYDFLTKAV